MEVLGACLCVNVCYQPLRGKYNKIYLSCELDRCESCLGFLASIAQKFRIKNFYSSAFLVVVKKMLSKKYAVRRKDITTTIFLLFSLFPKGTPFKCRKHPFVFCQTTVFMMLFQNCLTSRLFPISNSSRSGRLSPKT